jgi:hypothetical protein
MWWKLSWNIAAANLEAQQVIALRLMKLAKGGPAAQKEAHKMVSEKMMASVEVAQALAGGASTNTVLRRYRTIMRANRKRLSS